MTDDTLRPLTNDPQELLAAKQEADKQKLQFTSFVRSVSGDAPTEKGQVVEPQHRETDQQNNMKDVENRMLE
ncbi:hypothetical protein [Paenibacillus woosongensis]|uniref:Uncharacterized protein n=1 Tax=Paenibacillus woosongensis TaxID=307580 RepID=A0ABQ4MYR2_9BACL|nr:hypothetical protein [Paenibacillus woosongensis]GIP61010.1 hypothetical protein J15TS10_48240 [Paenibacillus woosongensis]